MQNYQKVEIPKERAPIPPQKWSPIAFKNAIDAWRQEGHFDVELYEKIVNIRMMRRGFSSTLEGINSIDSAGHHREQLAYNKSHTFKNSDIGIGSIIYELLINRLFF